MKNFEVTIDYHGTQHKDTFNAFTEEQATEDAVDFFADLLDSYVDDIFVRKVEAVPGLKK